MKKNTPVCTRFRLPLTVHSDQQSRRKQVVPSPSSFSSDTTVDLLVRRSCSNKQSDIAVLDALSLARDTPLSSSTYLSLLKTSIWTKSFPIASGTRAHIINHGIPLHDLLGDYLVMALAKCGAIEDACHIYSLLPCLSVFAWSSIISAYADSQRGLEAVEAWQRMHNESVEPDSFAFLSLFKACASIPDIKKGRVLHALARWEGFSSNIFVGNAIVSMYANHGLLPEAQQAFDELSHRTSVSWNLLISGCVQQGEWHKALDLHRQMQVDGAELDSFTFVSLFKACGSIPDLSFGRELHAHAKAKGLDSNPFVGNTIMCMYNKCGDLRGAEDAFCVLSGWDVFSWTCMLSAYVDHGEDESALLLYRQMCNEGIIPDDATFTVVLQACSMLAEKSDSGSALHRARRESLLQLAWALRADIHRSNRCLDVTVATAFVFLYGKCGSLSAAENTFSSIEHPDQAAWNAMLSAYIHNKQEEFALHLYVHMQKQDNSPNVITLVTVLHACGVLVEKSRLYGNGGRCNSIFMEIARSIHMDVCTQGFESDQSIANTLISVYGKCGVIVEADCIFNSTLEFDVVSWNAMLSGCVGLGQGEKALYLFEKMQGTHVIPDEVTYMAVCQASAKTGSLHICKHVHFIVLCVGYDSILAVQVTFMDTYGSLGRIVDAQAVFDCLLQPNDVSWNACMASQALVDIKTSISMLELMNQSMVRPNAVTLTSILSVCSHWGLVEDGFWYIYYMIGNNNISLEQTHLKLMIDILGRAEDFKRINWLLHYMPMYSDPVIWLSVLDICVSHGNFELGKQALDHVSLCRSQESGSFS